MIDETIAHGMLQTSSLKMRLAVVFSKKNSTPSIVTKYVQEKFDLQQMKNEVEKRKTIIVAAIICTNSR